MYLTVRAPKLHNIPAIKTTMNAVKYEEVEIVPLEAFIKYELTIHIF